MNSRKICAPLYCLTCPPPSRFSTYQDSPCMQSILLLVYALVPCISIRLLFKQVPQGSCFHPLFLHS
jgi:hypothetical protein